MNKIDLTEWRQVGAGGNGKTYVPAEPAMGGVAGGGPAGDGGEAVMLKVNKGSGAKLERVKEEFESAEAVREMGVMCPRMYEIVDMGKGKYGTLCQFIKGKKSLCRICADEPERIGEMARLLFEKGEELHALECSGSRYKPVSSHVLAGLKYFKPFLPKEYIELVKSWVEALPDVNTCLHGDMNPGNLIVAQSGIYWIDLGRFAYGDPMFDVAHLFYFSKVMAYSKIVQDLAHMSEEQLNLFWKEYMAAAGIVEAEDVAAYERKLMKYVAMDCIARHSFQPSRLLAFLTAPRIKAICKVYALSREQ